MKNRWTGSTPRTHHGELRRKILRVGQTPTKNNQSDCAFTTKNRQRTTKNQTCFQYIPVFSLYVWGSRWVLWGAGGCPEGTKHPDGSRSTGVPRGTYRFTDHGKAQGVSPFDSSRPAAFPHSGCWTYSLHCQITNKNPSKRWIGEFWGFRICVGWISTTGFCVVGFYVPE